MDSSPGKCCVCMERPPFGQMTTASRHNVCHDCIRQTFQRALDYEGNYPPKWGNHILDIRKYTQQRILTQEFLGRYHQKEREYRCPPANRIYCSWPRHGTVQHHDDKGKGIDKGKAIDDRCNTFLGAMIRSTVDVLSNNGELVVRCKECYNLSCRACETHIHGLTQAMNHKCLSVRAADPDDAAFQGLTRGKDFQLCPFEECERKIELNDGCNHIRCPCGMQFCFICGQPAMEGSGHWSRIGDTEPGCPRWNQPGVSASWDDAPIRGLRALNPFVEYRIAQFVLDENTRPPYATEAINPASPTLRALDPLREALNLPRHTADLQVLDLVEAEDVRREVLNAAQEVLSLQRHYDAWGSAPARIEQLTHDFQALSFMASAEVARDEEQNDRRRRRLTIVSLDTAAPAPAHMTGPQRHGHPYHIEPTGEFAVDNEERHDMPDQPTPLQQHQRRLQTIQRELEGHARRWPENHAGTSRGDPSTPNRDWRSMLPVPTLTNAPVASLRSRSNRTDGSRVQELADNDTGAEGSGKEDASKRGSRMEE